MKVQYFDSTTNIIIIFVNSTYINDKTKQRAINFPITKLEKSNREMNYNYKWKKEIEEKRKWNNNQDVCVSSQAR